MNCGKVRMWWAGVEQGWVLDVERALPDVSVRRCIQHTFDIQEQRYHALTPGPKKDDCLDSMHALMRGQVQQNIVGTGDKVLFDAYKSDKKFITLGGN